ncbi:uncharacterized protein [Pyxicephalus adspersus]|uniref:uncharacterized protein isoform X2 n=1 Tax=Pyxicephalus adspersus TaxID=30357 RepID=UPI003B59073F
MEEPPAISTAGESSLPNTQDSTSPLGTETLEEELWLYGGSPTRSPDESGSTSGHTRSFDPLQDISTGSLDQKEESPQFTQSFSDDEEDSDTDSDDVEVTIGNIHPCMEPAGFQRIIGNRGYGAAGKLPPRGIDFAAPGSINGVPVLEVDLDSFEEKPWRKPGADISDYFNYGFNEATWKVYCEKQRRLQLGLDSAYHTNSKGNKITVQQGRMGNADRGRENGFEVPEMQFNTPNTCKKEILPEASRNGNRAGNAESVGEICNISRVEGRRWDIQEPDETLFEVVGNHEYKSHDIIQHRQPPPPLLPPPNIPPNPRVYNELPPPPLFYHRSMTASQAPASLHPQALLPPPLIPPPSVHIPPPSGPPNTYNSRPPSRNGYYTTGQGVVNYHSVPTDQTSWVTTVDKGTCSLGGNDWRSRRQNEREHDRSSNLNSIQYKGESDRYVNYNRERDYECERKNRHSREGSWSREDKTWAEQKQREESSKHKSSSRRKQDSEEKETHRRHRRKKSKRGKGKSSDEEVATRGNRHDPRE